jgi:hypothetical protein
MQLTNCRFARTLGSSLKPRNLWYRRSILMSANVPSDVQRQKKPSQGELVQAVLTSAPSPLVDIGANLCDKSFDGVGGILSVPSCLLPVAMRP